MHATAYERFSSRRFPRSGLSAAALLVAGAAASPALGAGTWEDPGTSAIVVNATGDYLHDAFPGCGPPVGDNEAVPAGAYIPGFAGRSFGALAHANARDRVPGCLIRGASYGRATVAGVGTSTVDVRWKTSAEAQSICECAPGYFYDAGGQTTFNTTIRLTIDTVPVGAPVTVHYAWWALVNCFYDPELSPPEDPASVNNVTFEVASTQLIPAGSANFVNVRALAFLPANPSDAAGSFTAHGGDTIVIRVTGTVMARITVPPDVPFLQQDASYAQYNGQILLSIDDPLPPLPHPANPTSTTSEFSLDIGSDTEMSDPTLEGNEMFDPGDTYPWYGPPLPAGGADGVRDDALALWADFWPQAPDGPPAGTGAPSCSGLLPSDVAAQRFDLDGTDALDVSLRDVIPPSEALSAPIPRFASRCIWDDPYLMYSLDDDWASHYTESFFCSVPSEQTSDLGLTYGTTAKADEIQMIGTSTVWLPPPGGPLALAGPSVPILSETTLHPALAPDPSLGEQDDDDVDALDVGSGICETWYLSADHEATGLLPGTFLPLDPGDVYEVLPLGGLAKVVDEAIHLGIAEEADLDAFEFVWLPRCLDAADPASCTEVLALLFSVDADDLLTAGADESGGLDPAMVYGSFLDGSSFEYLEIPLAEDVDALAAFHVPLIAPPVTVPGCGPDVDCDGTVGFADLLLVLSSWGPCFGCPEDIDGDGIVGFNDLLLVLSNWS